MDYQNRLGIYSAWHRPFGNMTIKKSGRLWLIVAFLLSMAALQTGQDFLHAYFNNYRGYLSESLIFKLYWVLFIPVGSLLFFFPDEIKKTTHGKPRWLLWLVAVVALSFIHTFLTAGLISSVSGWLLESPFPFRTPFRYFASEHFYLTMFFYAAGIGIVLRPVAQRGNSDEPDTKKAPGNLVKFIPVTIQNKVIPIAVEEIICVRADRPYINIHTSGGQYLYNGTIKEMHAKLGSRGFVRVHRSTIINPTFVRYIRSRSNGDYDVTLKNGDVVRMSRNYYAAFKNIVS